MDSGVVPPLPLPPDIEDFKILIASCGKRIGGPSLKLVKKVYILLVELSANRICRFSLNLAAHGLLG